MLKKNEEPSSYTFIYWLIQDEKIAPDDLFVFLELYWPTFLKKDGYVFLKEHFSDEYYDSLVKENDNPEYWINLLTIDDFFSELSDGEAKSMTFAKNLGEAWSAKLKKEFPEMSFVAECLWNEEHGDCGLTFYQSDGANTSLDIGCFNEISVPNIKENRLMESSHGPRPGMPKIRKPRPDELPK